MKSTRFFSRMPASGWVGLAIVAATCLVAVIAAVWTPYDPLHAEPAQRLAGPSMQHWLGTDRFGRDVASRLMAGAQITLFVGVVAVVIAGVVGVPLGIAAGIAAGAGAGKHSPADALIMRAADIILAFPALLLAIMAGAVWGPSTLTAMLAIGVAGIPSFTRVARAATLQVIHLDYVASARVSGLSLPAIAVRHVWPNISGMVIVQASVYFALAILAEAALSYLGLGTAPPAPSWGRMLQDAQSLLGVNPWLAAWPGLAIALTVLGFNLLGDALRDTIDPRLQGRRP